MTYKVQIDDEVRDATSEEIERIETEQKESANRQAALKAIIAAKESARSKLKALGLTDDEIAALGG